MIVELLLLIIIANAAPVILSYLFHHRPSLPVDFGIDFFDKKPFLGDNKTWRGLLSSLIITALAAKLLGLGYITGLQLASLAMAGDLLSSFIKRRINQQPGAQFLILDQLPEALLPAWFLMDSFELELMQVMVVVTGFIIIERGLSLLFFKLGVRKSSY